LKLRLFALLQTLALTLNCVVGCNKAPSEGRDKEIAELRAQVQALQHPKEQAPRVAVAAPTQRQATERSKAAAKTVYRELLKLRSVTETGVNVNQYSERLLNAKAEIEASISDVDNRSFQVAAAAALNAYVDAGRFWISCKGKSLPDLRSVNEKAQVEELYGKYGIKVESIGGDRYYIRSTDVRLIWTAASALVDRMAETQAAMLQ
jgi:hypothetical protein